MHVFQLFCDARDLIFQGIEARELRIGVLKMSDEFAHMRFDQPDRFDVAARRDVVKGLAEVVLELIEPLADCEKRLIRSHVGQSLIDVRSNFGKASFEPGVIGGTWGAIAARTGIRGQIGTRRFRLGGNFHVFRFVSLIDRIIQTGKSVRQNRDPMDRLHFLASSR